MQQQTEIAYQLRKLKLSSLLDTLESRLLEGQQNQLDYRTFLSLLLQDELEARQARKIQKRIKDARFTVEQTLENYDFTLAPHVNKTQIRELATSTFLRNGQGVILVGPPGTGKTHLAKALGHEACRRDHAVMFYKCHQLFTDLSRADLAGKLDKIMKKIIQCDLLILDDFAFKKIDQTQSEYLYAIVDARYGAKSIILTSNRAMSDWMGIFPDPVIAGAILDRLAHQAFQIQLKGESIRKKLAQNARPEK